jgi:hypothetical protein
MLPQDAFGQGVYGQPGLKVCGCHPKGLDKGHYISAIDFGITTCFVKIADFLLLALFQATK